MVRGARNPVSFSSLLRSAHEEKSHPQECNYLDLVAENYNNIIHGWLPMNRFDSLKGHSYFINNC